MTKNFWKQRWLLDSGSAGTREAEQFSGREAGKGPDGWGRAHQYGQVRRWQADKNRSDEDKLNNNFKNYI